MKKINKTKKPELFCATLSWKKSKQTEHFIERKLLISEEWRENFKKESYLRLMTTSAIYYLVGKSLNMNNCYLWEDPIIYYFYLLRKTSIFIIYCWNITTTTFKKLKTEQSYVVKLYSILWSWNQNPPFSLPIIPK